MFIKSDVGLVKGQTMSYVTTAPVAAAIPRPSQDGGSWPLKDNISIPFEDQKLAQKEAQEEAQKVESGQRRGSLFRSASDINLHNASHKSTDGTNEDSTKAPGNLKRGLSEQHLQTTTIGTKDKHSNQSGSTIEGVRKSLRRHSLKLRKQPKIVLPPTVENGEIAQLPKAIVKNGRSMQGPSTSVTSPSKSPEKKQSTWMLGPSRSPSPTGRTALEPSTTKLPERVAMKNKSSTETNNVVVEPPRSPNVKQTPMVQKERSPAPKARRPLSAVFGRTKSLILEGENGAPPLPKSMSTDRLPLPSAQRNGDGTPLPSATTKEQGARSNGTETPRKKDELWSTFRTLDGDFQKFLSKSSTLKSNILRSSLLPFLRQYADHPSNTSLRAEDLDRRVNILNKWWTGLLEMLNGRNGQSVSGNDRPAVLEGLSTIMSRPEWQLTVSSVSSKPDKKGISSIKNRSTTSLASNMSDFLSESVIHNVRNTFVQNLLSQMAFVVDRMSQRNAPASVVAFCGKACAYAFFYCPGIADILVRLWGLSADTLRRVLEEHGFPRTTNLSSDTEEANRYYPAHLQSLCFTSVSKVMRSLRSRPSLPLNSFYIPWNGPWVSRWSGRDSDLFFSFVKHYHALSHGMLPEASPIQTRLAAPCNMFIEGQLLVVMDATIHRGAQASLSETETPAMTFDDIMGADASAIPLAPQVSNANRSMAENRLVMLLREFLSNSPAVKEEVRKSFAELFGHLLKASAKRVSVYDHNACFTLCDLLEECFSILSRYYRNNDDPELFLDFDFWFKVLKEMGESNNTMTEVRLFAFVYRFWSWIQKNEERKRQLCLDWLLREDYALRQFSHWCPMVRTYYMRVMCWKVLKHDDNATDTDLEVYQVASQRLRTLWSHFLYFQQQASETDTISISTAPSNPAPGRRMIIIRDDSVPAPTGTFQAFDGGVVSPTSSQPNAYERYTSLDPIKNMSPPESKKEESSSKKRWSTFRSINPFSSTPPTPAPQAVSSNRPPLPTAHAHPPPLSASAVKAASSSSSPTETPVYYQPIQSFKFSLEWADRAVPPRDRKLAPPRLPAPAQMHLQANSSDPGLPEPKKPVDEEGMRMGKYVGRALAEWAVVLAEFQGFGEKRMSSGVKGWGRVESPWLGVEGFKIKG